MIESPDFLIVYGTLQPLFKKPFAQFLCQRSQYMGEATFPGLLFDLGWFDASNYPGAIYLPNGTKTVCGTVFNIRRHKHCILAYLDDYEEIGKTFNQPNEYVRAVIPVQCDGVRIDCWVYLYNRPTDGLLIVASGDYGCYRRNE